jgi:hypothetical protein
MTDRAGIASCLSPARSMAVSAGAAGGWGPHGGRFDGTMSIGRVRP